MPKKAGIVCTILGAVLILSALLLLFYNRYEADQAGRETERLLADMQSLIPAGAAQPDEAGREALPEPAVVQINGYGYLGYLSIPALDLALPIMSEWDYARLKIAPCRQFGSPETDDLVIAAHNYKQHFGEIAQLQAGDAVAFTEMDGVVNNYTIALIATVIPTEVGTVQNSGYDLVLYTCTYGGKMRVAVFCTRADLSS